MSDFVVCFGLAVTTTGALIGMIRDGVAFEVEAFTPDDEGEAIGFFGAPFDVFAETGVFAFVPTGFLAGAFAVTFFTVVLTVAFWGAFGGAFFGAAFEIVFFAGAFTAGFLAGAAFFAGAFFFTATDFVAFFTGIFVTGFLGDFLGKAASSA